MLSRAKGALALTAFSFLAAAGAWATEGNSVSYKFQYYKDNNIVSVLTNLISTTFGIGEHTHIGADFLADAITGASRRDHHQNPPGPDGITSASPRRAGVDAVTSATPTDETRKQFSGSLSYTRDFLKLLRAGDAQRDDPTTLGLSGITSSENDYSSNTFGLSLSQDLLQRNLTLALSWSRSFDQYRPPARYIPSSSDEGWNYLGNGHRKTNHIDAAITEGVTTTTETSLMAGIMDDRGYLARPYYSYKINDTYYPENLPPTHAAMTVTAKVNQFLPIVKGWALHGTYRYYKDSWAQQSHTLEFELYTRLFDHIILRPLVRYYTQTSAFFYQDVYTTVPRYLTTDFRYRAGHATSGGAKFIWELDDFVKPENGSLLGLWIIPTSFDVSFDYYGRSSTADYLVRNTHYNYWNVKNGFSAYWVQTGFTLQF
jgi:hypothetical protein